MKSSKIKSRREEIDRERPIKVEKRGRLVGTQPIPSSLLGQYPAPYSANTEPIPRSPTIQITRIQESAKILLTNRKLRI